ncbi:hypothetical protein CU044_3489 [Streptomyces sp. L-9-10]|nr:hypothetical protein CU044_3489 [Streptomyces sp. L-9-10]
MAAFPAYVRGSHTRPVLQFERRVVGGPHIHLTRLDVCDCLVSSAHPDSPSLRLSSSSG